MNNWNKLALIPLFIIFFAGVTYFGLDYYSDFNKDNSFQNKVKEQSDKDNISKLVKEEKDKLNNKLEQEDILRISKGAKLILKAVDQAQKMGKIREIVVDDSLLGLTEEELKDELESGEIVEFTPQKIVVEVRKENQDVAEKIVGDINNSKIEMSKQIKENEEKENMGGKLYLGIKDGYVAIYKGDSLGEKKLQEVRRNIPVKDLVLEDKEELIKGIEVETEDQLLSILEGFVSAVDE